jgi:hypothetical protein
MQHRVDLQVVTSASEEAAATPKIEAASPYKMLIVLETKILGPYVVLQRSVLFFRNPEIPV